MTNKQRFFINGMLMSLVGIAVRSVSLLFNSFITHKIGAEGIGLFTLIGTVYSFAVTFSTSGISLTVTRLVSAKLGEGRGEEVPRILRSAVLYALIFGSFATLVLFVGAEYFGVSVLSDARTVRPLRILALSLVPIALSSVYSGYFIGVKRVLRNAVVQVAGQLFKIIITAALIVRFASLGIEDGCIALAASITLTELSVFLVALLEFLWDKARSFKSSKGESGLSDVLGMALPLALSAYVRSALLTLEHILIPRRLADRGESHEDALAQYGILHGMALPMLMYPMSPLSSFAGLLVPEFSESLARNEHSRMARIGSDALNTTLTYATAAAVLLAFFSEEIGYTVYSSYEAGAYIRVMAPVIPVMYLDHVADSMLKGIGEHVYSMWVNISDSVLSVALVWVLIPQLGILGYGIVIMVMEGYNFILSIIKLRTRVKFSVDIIDSLAIPLGAALASASLTGSLFRTDGALVRPIWLFAKLAFSVCIFVALLLCVRMLAKKIKTSPKKSSERLTSRENCGIIEKK